MSGETARKWTALILWAVVLSTGCATETALRGRNTFLEHGPRASSSPALADEVRGDSAHAAMGPDELARLYRRRDERVVITKVAMSSPAEMAVRAVASGTVQKDAFEYLLTIAGLDNINDLPPRGAPLTPQEAARVFAVLLQKPVTLGSFPPRMAICYLLLEVQEGGQASREELLRRVERFRPVAVLRPDGYLAWTLNGRTQQRVGPVEWKHEAFRAGPFELGRFYTSNGWILRQADAQLRPVMEGPPLAEVYDDADYATRLPPERLNGFRIFGNKGLVGQTFQRNILLIEAEIKGATSLKQLVAAFEAEARAAGATRLSMTGHAVINQGLLSPAIAQRFGFTFRLINKDTIELVKELLP